MNSTRPSLSYLGICGARTRREVAAQLTLPVNAHSGTPEATQRRGCHTDMPPSTRVGPLYDAARVPCSTRGRALTGARAAHAKRGRPAASMAELSPAEGDARWRADCA